MTDTHDRIAEVNTSKHLWTVWEAARRVDRQVRALYQDEYAKLPQHLRSSLKELQDSLKAMEDKT